MQKANKIFVIAALATISLNAHSASAATTKECAPSCKGVGWGLAYPATGLGTITISYTTADCELHTDIILAGGLTFYCTNAWYAANSDWVMQQCIDAANGN